MNPDRLMLECRRLPLFPLPGAVLMPGSVMPLHVFEPRYRQLVEDCLAGKPLCVPQILPGEPYDGQPRLMPWAGVGVLAGHRRLPDGRYNILIEPIGRVKLLRDIASDAPYRVAEAEIHWDVEVDPVFLEGLGERIRMLAAPLFRGNAEGWEAFGRVPAGQVPGILAGHLIGDAEERQRFLAEDDPVVRGRMVEEAVLVRVAEKGGVVAEG